MANIFTSSIGKKLIMSITGAFLILFPDLPHDYERGAGLLRRRLQRHREFPSGPSWFCASWGPSSWRRAWCSTSCTPSSSPWVTFGHAERLQLCRDQTREKAWMVLQSVRPRTRRTGRTAVVLLQLLVQHAVDRDNRQACEQPRLRSEGGCRDGEVRLLARRVCHRLYRIARGAVGSTLRTVCGA